MSAVPVPLVARPTKQGPYELSAVPVPLVARPTKQGAYELSAVPVPVPGTHSFMIPSCSQNKS